MRTLLAISTFLLLLATPNTTQCQTGRVGIGTTAPLAPLHVDSTVLFTGSLNLAAPAPLPVTGPGTRMLWYPDRAAFRAGRVTGTQWDLADIGKFSVALGINTHASGDYSFAAGRWSDAFGSSSAALGHLSRAADNSFAAGKNADASGYTSVSLDFGTTASGNNSVAIGASNHALGQYSITLGTFTRADAFQSLSFGRNNLGGGNGTQWVPTDPIFEVGIGNPNPANAMTILKNGRVGLGIHQPKETLEVNGAVRLGTNADSAPAPGTIRWNATTGDFEGYTGSDWKSLTRTESWGNNAALENNKVVASDGAHDDRFGFSVSISGDYAIIGAYLDDDNGPNSGSAYIFHRSGSTWSQQAKLLASDGAPDDLLGCSVSISGEYIVVGASAADAGANLDVGSAYFYKRN